MADEKNSNEKLTEEQKAAQKVAKAFLKAKAKAVREKATAQKEVKQVAEIRKKRQARLREAEKALESFKENDDILKSLAGLEIKKDEKEYQEKAAECLFKLLAKIRKYKEQAVNDNANKKPTLQDLIAELNPANVFFTILENVAEYDENTKVLSIDCKNLYTQLGKRIEKQTELLTKAKTTSEDVEATVEAEVEAKKTKTEQSRKAKKGKATDKVSDDSSATNEKIVIADSGESNNNVLEEEKANAM